MMVSKEKPLNISRTKNYFSQLGLSSHLFAFNSLGNGMCHCITYNYLPKEDWAVFYSERGNRYDVKEFANEDDACRYLIDTVISSFLYHINTSEESRKNGKFIFSDEFP